MADNCCATLGNIEKNCGGSAPVGLAPKMWIICSDDVVEIPAPFDFDPTQPVSDTNCPHSIVDDLVLADPDPETGETPVFSCWNIQRKTGDYKSEPQGEGGEDGNLVTIDFFIPKITPEKTRILNGANGMDAIIIFTDKCGNQRILGDLICGGMILTVTEQVNKNGYQIQGTWESANLPYWYKGAIPS